jgi:hypothetical protein
MVLIHDITCEITGYGLVQLEQVGCTFGVLERVAR